MDLQHVNAKIFVDGELNVAPERFIELFHRWIQEGTLAERFMLDVADYRHVPSGPGVVLIGLNEDFAFDNGAGRCGMLYNRKAPLDGSNADRLRQALASAAEACELVEKQLDGVKFSRQEFQLVVNDRALAPNTPQTYEACQPEIEAFVTEALGHSDFRLAQETEPRRRFGVTVHSVKPFELAELQ